jgi:hypothetical protein
MKIKYFLVGFMVLVGFSFFTDTNASANTKESTDFISQVKIFDENGIQIPYTTEELEQFIKFEPAEKPNFTTMVDYRRYNYGPITFAYNFYVGPGSNGRAFLNPFDTIIDVSGTASKMRIEAYNDTGTGSGTLARSIELPGGWQGGIHISSWGSLPRDKSYRFKFVNLGTSFTISNVGVLYDHL